MFHLSIVNVDFKIWLQIDMCNWNYWSINKYYGRIFIIYQNSEFCYMISISIRVLPLKIWQLDNPIISIGSVYSNLFLIITNRLWLLLSLFIFNWNDGQTQLSTMKNVHRTRSIKLNWWICDIDLWSHHFKIYISSDNNNNQYEHRTSSISCSYIYKLCWHKIILLLFKWSYYFLLGAQSRAKFKF